MSNRLTDTEVDAVQPSWSQDPSEPSLIVADVPIADDPSRRIVAAFMSVRREWDDVWLLAACVATRRSCSTDRRSVTFASERYGRPGYLYLADGTEQDVEVAEPAGLRLLGRWLRVLLDGAEQHQFDVVNDPEWASFTSNLGSIERMVTTPESGDEYEQGTRPSLLPTPPELAPPAPRSGQGLAWGSTPDPDQNEISERG